MGGGNPPAVWSMVGRRGLSPRGRGKHHQDAGDRLPARSIPAWAGETHCRLPLPSMRRVYPRVGGGNSTRPMWVLVRIGLSPRGRGKPFSSSDNNPSSRSIPAWAGETLPSRTLIRLVRVYPRVGGGNSAAGTRVQLVIGLSPRGRGKPRIPIISGKTDGSIPAWAGETPPAANRPHRPPVYPRVGGGNGLRAAHLFRHLGLSPRGRGKPGRATARNTPTRSIPAWAGETLFLSSALGGRRVYPRVGGGNFGSYYFNLSVDGLSPRGRGKPGQTRTSHDR